jgi:single-stranded DNA-binding protein
MANSIEIIGELTNDLELSHTLRNGEDVYSFKVQTVRNSGVYDFIPCYIASGLVRNMDVGTEDRVHVVGEVRTKMFNGHVAVYVWCTSLTFAEVTDKDMNVMELTEGVIVKRPIFRETPTGKQICDMIIASNNERCSRSSYIPCITWGRFAVIAEMFNVGERVCGHGRFQSRFYDKKLEDGTVEERIAYEISLYDIMEKGEENIEN